MLRIDALIEQLPLWRDRPVPRFAATLLLVVLSIVIRIVLEPWLHGFPFLTFFPAVIVTAFLFGPRCGLLAGLLCGVAAWYLFLRPSDGFAILGTGGLGLAFYAFVIATDVGLVHLMQQRQEALVAERGRATALAKSRELLFRELQHRVANNLQMAAAMVSLQKRSIRDPASRALLDEAAGRLSLIGRTSRSLYDPSGGAVGLEAMLERVARDACEANGRPDVELEVMATTRPVIHPDTAIPVALIVAECIANAIEHGLAGGRAGRIAINIDAEGSDTLISIRDNGGGLPQGFRPEAQDSLGLTIMRALTSQFGGRFTLTDASPGTEARLTIPPGRPTTLPPLRP